ncbi:MAG: hypothetical protein R3E66_13315 [bacterium]
MNERRPLWDNPTLVWSALVLLWTAGLVRRMFFDFVPGDFTAYISAADVFVAGQNPYTEARFATPRYDGFPYNYFPGTLFLIAPMAYLSTTVLVTADWVARACALVFVGRTLKRHIVPDMATHHLGVLMLLHEPLVIDQLVGNMVTYLIAAWALCLELSKRSGTLLDVLAAFLAGVVLSFKPFWLIPAGWVLVSRRCWSLTVALVLGVASTPLASLLLLDMIPAFRAHTQQMREFYFSVDLLTLAPWALAVMVPASVVGALLVWRRYPSEWVFLLGCVSVPIWPRVATYSYVITLPFSLYLIRRFGWGRGLALSCVTLGPLPWLLRDAGVLPGEQLENWVMYIWCWCAALLCVWCLKRESEETDAV